MILKRKLFLDKYFFLIIPKIQILILYLNSDPIGAYSRRELIKKFQSQGSAYSRVSGNSSIYGMHVYTFINTFIYK